jgi:hypothetical protein
MRELRRGGQKFRFISYGVLISGWERWNQEKNSTDSFISVTVVLLFIWLERWGTGLGMENL